MRNMSLHGVLAMLAALTLVALSTGSVVFLAPAALLALMLCYAWISVTWTVTGLSIRCAAPETRVRRGDALQLTLSVSCSCPLPVGGMGLRMTGGPELAGVTYDIRGLRGQTVTVPFTAAHVGVLRPGVDRCTVSDVFGLFTRTWTPPSQAAEILVLPQTFEVQPLSFAPVEATLGTMALATEDLSSPADIRGYQPGDPMKRIHWKLSARKQELMVRRFEEPVLPEALILLDCTQPPASGGAEAAAALRDALLEGAASVLAGEARRGHTVRLPLQGGYAMEVSSDMGPALAMEHIAQVDFSDTGSFERVLQLESQRLRSVGATVVLTARLSGAVVETMASMRRLGPTLRLMLATDRPDDPAWLPFIDRLQLHDIAVDYIRAQ